MSGLHAAAQPCVFGNMNAIRNVEILSSLDPALSPCGTLLHGWGAVVPELSLFLIISLTADRGNSNRDEISWTVLLQRWQPITVVPGIIFVSQTLANGDWLLILCSCGNRSDQKTWIRLLSRGGVQVYFSHHVLINRQSKFLSGRPKLF